MASVSTSAANAIRIHHVPSTKILPALPPTTTTFSFGVPSFQITTTRALLSDTDFATLGIVVAAEDGEQLSMYGPTTVSVGDVGNGSHWLGMLVSGIDVPDGATMNVSFTIMNKGSSQLKDEIAHDLDMVCEGILGALAGGQLASLSHPRAATPKRRRTRFRSGRSPCSSC